MTSLLTDYHAATTAAVLADRSDRSLLRMHGRDPLRILQGVVTNDVANAPADAAVYAALLTAKGRMVSDMRIIRRPQDFLLDVPAAALPALTATFRKTVPPLFARFEDVSESWRVTGVYGPDAEAALRPHVPLPARPEEHALVYGEYRGEPCIVVNTRDAGVAGYDVVASISTAESLRQALALPSIGEAALDVLRIEAGLPRWGAELTDTTIPLEAGLLHAISTSKGCYTGQEVIIRILHRGHVNWHLRGVLLGEADRPARDTPLLHAATGKPVGRITSAAWSPRFEQEIALAYVRREVEPPAVLQLGSQDGAEVRVVALPFA